MIVLGISTATPRGSVALVEDARLLGRVAYQGKMHHAERIFGALEQLVATSGVERAAIGAVSCDVGPGSFTGIRAGLAAAKGIALGLGLPLLGVGSLAAMAAAAWASAPAPERERVVCLLDARRSETFFAAYDRQLCLRAGPGHVRSVELLDALGELAHAPDACFAGSQALTLCPPLEPTRVLSDEDCALPDAAWIARLGLAELARGAVPSLDQVEPLYLRAPDVSRPRAG